MQRKWWDTWRIKSHPTYPNVLDLLYATDTCHKWWCSYSFLLLIMIMCVVIYHFFFSPTQIKNKMMPREDKTKQRRKKRRTKCLYSTTYHRAYSKKNKGNLSYDCNVSFVSCRVNEKLLNEYMNPRFSFLSFFLLSTSVSCSFVNRE